MRLTECVFDEYFNLINPEKNVNEIYADNPALFGGRIFRKTTQDEGSTTLTINTINSTSIVFTSSVSLIGGDEIFTLDNKFVGTISSTGSGTTHNVTGTTNTPDMDSTTNRSAFRITDAYTTEISGRKETDSVFGRIDTGGYHPLKGVILPKTGDYNYGSTGSTFKTDNNGVSLSVLLGTELVLPSVFSQQFLTDASYGSQDGATSHVLEKMALSSGARRNPHGGTIGVVLDTYPIEGGSNLLEVGDNTDVLGSSGSQRGGVLIGTSPTQREIITLTSVNHYKKFLSPTQTSQHDYSSDSDRESPADGAFFGFQIEIVFFFLE